MVDGDKLLVVADKTIIKVAERNMQDIVPLYYNMKKALPHSLTNENIYDGLIHAFTGGNIGIYSNNISKIWNDEVFITGTDEEKTFNSRICRRGRVRAVQRRQPETGRPVSGNRSRSGLRTVQSRNHNCHYLGKH